MDDVKKPGLFDNNPLNGLEALGRVFKPLEEPACQSTSTDATMDTVQNASNLLTHPASGSATSPDADPEPSDSSQPGETSDSSEPDGPEPKPEKPAGDPTESKRSPDDVAQDVRRPGPTTKIIGRATITKGTIFSKPGIYWGHAKNGQDQHGLYLTMTPTAHDGNKYRFGFYPMKPGYPMWWKDKHRAMCIAELNKPQIRLALESLVYTDPSPLVVNPHRILEAAGHGDGGPLN